MYKEQSTLSQEGNFFEENPPHEYNNDSPMKKVINFNSGRWSSEEHKKFLYGIFEYGNEWKKVQNIIKTRSSTQARSHAQKFFLKLKKNLKRSSHSNSSNDPTSRSSPSSYQHNFSIKYFFQLLSSQDNNSITFDNRHLTQSQREKVLNIVSKFSNMESPKSKISKININNDKESQSQNDKNFEQIKVKGINDRIFRIIKDYSRKELVNKIIMFDKKENDKMNWIIDGGERSNINNNNNNKKKECSFDSELLNMTKKIYYNWNFDKGIVEEGFFENPNFFPEKRKKEKLGMKNENNYLGINPFSLNFEVGNNLNENEISNKDESNNQNQMNNNFYDHSLLNFD